MTATSNSYKTTNGVTYKDFQVAQHTKKIMKLGLVVLQTAGKQLEVLKHL